MCSKNSIIAIVSTTLLASVCLPTVVSAQFYFENQTGNVLLGGVNSSANNQPALSVSKEGTLVTGGNATLSTSGSAADGIRVDTSGEVNLTNMTVTTTGQNSNGLFIVGPGTITLTGSTVTTEGSGLGARIQGEGSILNLTNTNITAASDAAIYGYDGASISVTGGKLVSGGIPQGDWAVELNNSNATLTGVEIESTSGGVKAVSQNSGTSDVTLSDVTIKVTNPQGSAVYAGGEGTTVDITGSKFSTEGQLSHGINALNKGTVTIQASEVAVVGANANAVAASGGAEITISDKTTISASGNNSTAVDVTSGSTVTLDDATVSATGTGTNSRGVRALGAGTKVIIKNGTTITTANNGSAYGVASSDGALVELTDTTIDASGNGLIANTGGTVIVSRTDITAAQTGIMATARDDVPVEITVSDSTVKSAGAAGTLSYGMLANGSGAKITSTNVVVTTEGNGRSGFQAQDSGTIAMTGGKIATSSLNAAGGVVNSATADIDGTVITTSGERSDGLIARVDGIIDVTKVVVNTTGNDALGLNVYDSGIIRGDASITTTGVRAHGISAVDSGEINLENSVIKTTGLNAAAIAASQPANPNASPYDGLGTITIKNSVVSAEKGVSVLVESGAGLDLTLANTDLTLNNGTLFNVQSNGAMDASITGSNLKGAALRSQTGISNVTLNNSSWLVTGNSDLNSLGGTNSSMIEFAAPTGNPQNKNSYLTLTVGDYSSDYSIITFNTWLGDEASPTDLLKVTNDTSGNTIVRVNNTAGIGQQTTGNGIKIIEVGGESNGDFQLDQDYQTHDGRKVVVAGAYAYSLHKNGVSTPTDGDWYLRSQLMEDEPEGPLYQGGVPTYEAYPQALLGLNGLNTLQQRVGNRFWAGTGNRVIAQGADAVQPYAAPEEGGIRVEGNGVWGRIEGAHNKIDPRFSTSQTDYNQNVFKMQAGIDGLLNEAQNGTLLGGVFVQYVHGKTKTKSIHGDGEISTNGYGFGGTLTWYDNDGFYVDGQAQATWYRSDLSSNLANTGLISGNNGFGYAFSAETGKRFGINPEWSVTPQAQMVYSKVDFDSFDDVWGTSVSLDNGASLQGRLGLTLDQERSWQNANGLTDRSHVYGIANLYYEFLDGTRVDVAGTSFASKKDRVWGGVGLGGSYNWNDDKYSVYGEAIVNTSLNNFGDSYSAQGNVGFRMKW